MMVLGLIRKETATMSDGLKGSRVCGEWNSSGSFAALRMTAEISNYNYNYNYNGNYNGNGECGDSLLGSE
jgi:hypothetical protein